MTLDTILSSTATREVLSIGRSRDSLINHDGDRDWFKVNLVAGNTYKFALTRNGNFDPLLRLRGAKGNLIAENDDMDSRNRDSLINFKATTTGVYYLDVGGYKTSTGSYRLSASLAQASSSVASTPASASRPAGRSTTSGLDSIRDSILPQFEKTRQMQTQSAAQVASALGGYMRSDSRYTSDLSRSGLVMDSLIGAASTGYATYNW